MRIRQLSFLLSIWGVCTFLVGCDILGTGPCLEGTGPTVQQSRDLTAFSGIDIRLPGRVYLTGGPVHKISIDTYSNLQPEIKVEVEGTNLVIRSESCLEYDNSDATYRITLPNLDNVELKSSAEVRIQDLASDKKLRLNLSGSGFIQYTGNLQLLDVLHSGSGDVILTGSVQTLETTLSGSGRIQAFSMAAENAKVMVAGSGYQQVWVKQNLDATITGSGNIYYRGTPTISKYTPGKGILISSN